MTEKIKELHPGTDVFLDRHIGPTASDVDTMLAALGLSDLDQLVSEAIPHDIRAENPLNLDEPLTEYEVIARARELASQNKIWRSFIGMGYYNTIVPPVIQRNILENPGWYTQYTPYQAEIAQGRLEALINFQTMVADLTALPIANASLLDEGTAAAEAMAIAARVRSKVKEPVFLVDEATHPQTLAVLETRAEGLGITTKRVDVTTAAFDDNTVGILFSYPNSYGEILDLRETIARAKTSDAMVIMTTDLLALTMLVPPGELGADIAVGSAQRFGVPFGFGGPHAAFMATCDDLKRHVPGRIVGQSKDADGNPAYRLALQTREQHIRRERATSNICTSQVLLAVMAGFYAVWHGPDGLQKIAGRIHRMTSHLAQALETAGVEVLSRSFFDTLDLRVKDQDAVLRTAERLEINLRHIDKDRFALSLDETTTTKDLVDLVYVLTGGTQRVDLPTITYEKNRIITSLRRKSDFLTHSVFSEHRSEPKLTRYIHRLQSRDLSLTTSMIPLGSCTMKLNATTEMLPVTWQEFAGLHPFAPLDQARGYLELFRELEGWLSEITGMAATSLQPNAGSQGEYAGMMVIRKYHESRGEGHRDVCLIPLSAHGTNPASAVMAGMKVVGVKCLENGDTDIEDLKARIAEHGPNLAALMITYPSTHGVFEAAIRQICSLVHEAGGQVYLDGANMNAQVGLCRPGDFGADVCHLNLHKTFCIPHGGGGPGMGPICVASHLAPHLPGHPQVAVGGTEAVGAISAAPWGSASILPISWSYIAMLGTEGLTHATRIAILNANYMAHRLSSHYDILFVGKNGRVAHEFIVDLRNFKRDAGVEVEDVAKRLMDYGFHAPTVSWPVAGTMMIEPTESEALDELDRFCEAMISIAEEVGAIADGTFDRNDNPLKNAPHTALRVTTDTWPHAYSRQIAAFPAPWTRESKFWPAVARVDNAYGDRNLVCTCAGMSEYT